MEDKVVEILSNICNESNQAIVNEMLEIYLKQMKFDYYAKIYAPIIAVIVLIVLFRIIDNSIK